MSSVFISYAREDEAHARKIAEQFKQENWLVWTDQEIPPGETWAEVIGTSLEDAACVVVLWTPNSVVSQWVKKEARSGMYRQLLVPVLMEPTTIPQEFEHIEAADFTGGLFEAQDELKLLLKQVEHLVTQSRLRDERQQSHATSSFTTILTCVVLALMLQQVLTSEVLDQLDTLLAADDRLTETAPFLLLLIVLFMVVEHWRVLHVAHTDNDIVTLYMDVATFGLALVAADAYRVSIGSPPDIDLLERGTIALVAFTGLGVLRYGYSIWVAKALALGVVRLQFGVHILAVVLAIVGLIAIVKEARVLLFLLSLIGVVVIVMYLVMLRFSTGREIT